MGFFDFFKKKPETEDIRKEPAVADANLGPSEGEVESELVPLVGRIPFPAYRGNNPYARGLTPLTNQEICNRIRIIEFIRLQMNCVFGNCRVKAQD